MAPRRDDGHHPRTAGYHRLVADSPADELFRLARRELVAVLGAARSALDDAGRLASLGPAGPEWAQTALSAHLLAPVQDLDVAQTGIGAVLRVLAGLAPSTGAVGGWQAGLHGWDGADGQRRGLALAVRVTGGGGPPLAAALTITAGDSGPLVSLIASGAGAIPAEAPVAVALGDDARLLASGAIGGLLSVTFAADGPPTVAAATAGDHVEATLTGRVADIGVGGVGLRVGSVTVRVAVTVDPAGASALTASVTLPEAAFVFDPGPLAVLLGASLELPAELDLAAKPGLGITLNGSTELRVPLPTPGGLGVVDVRRLDGTLAAEGDDGLMLRLGVDADLRTAVALSPLEVTLQGLGSTLPFVFGPDAVGPRPRGAGVALPRGVAIALHSGLVSGGGDLAGGDGKYAGGFALTLPPMSVAAFGALDLPAPPGQPALSLVVVLGVRFPPPGVEIGFGFAVSGVGGVVGFNRRLDRDALTAAVLDGRAGQLLFPADPAAALPTVAAALPAVFPAAPGRFVVGPMLEVSWGGRLVHLVVAVVVELPAPARFTVLGKLTVTVPDEAAPLIFMQATVVAEIDTDTPSVMVVASLAGSNLVGMPLTGDLFLLTRGGEDPEFVISAGGFHPAFRAPAGVPALRRLGLRMRAAVVELRCDVYLAVTSSSVQFGARVEVSAELADCGLSGFFAFDALFVWDPFFRFSIDIAAGLTVEVFGETLLGISVDLTIEGPSPWHLVGEGHFSTFLFDVPISIDETWGGPPPAAQTVDLEAPLLAALAAGEAWRTAAQPAALAGVSLADDAVQGIADGTLLHPLGSVEVRERVLPLGVVVDRFASAPVPPQTWTIEEARLRAGDPKVQTTPLEDWFALGNFVNLTPDQQLSRPGYQQLDCGVTLIDGGAPVSALRSSEIDWDLIVIGDGVVQPRQPPPAWAGLDALQALPLDRRFAVGDWVPAPAARVDVLAEQPATVSLTSTVAVSGLGALGGAAVDAPVGSDALVRVWADKIASSALTASVVETWELAA